MVLRIGWVWASAYVRFRMQWGWAGPHDGPDPRRMFLVSWAAVRGSITLATALSVPLLTHTGEPFPQRELVVFLAAATIILTLFYSGIPLPWLIRKLHAPSEAAGQPEENRARVEVARAGIAAIAPRISQLVNDETLRIIEEELDEREMLSSAEPLRG
jgi:CPA1 family monovalent cation:H+ antiporter